MRITLTREEVLACILALERMEKPEGWFDSALRKLLTAMKMKPLEEMQK